MVKIPIEGEINTFCDNQAVYINTYTPKCILNKKHASIAYRHWISLAAMCVSRLAKTDTNLFN